MADGKIVQCIGAVVDVEFPRNAMPKIYDALKMEGSELTLEVQQQLGDGVVRTIALGTGIHYCVVLSHDWILWGSLNLVNRLQRFRPQQHQRRFPKVLS